MWLIKSSSKKLNHSRRSDYNERNFTFEFCTKIKRPYFCMKCLTETCHDKDHSEFRLQLHPILRLPRKTASKTKWK